MSRSLHAERRRSLFGLGIGSCNPANEMPPGVQEASADARPTQTDRCARIRVFVGLLRLVGQPVGTACPQVCAVRKDPDEDVVLGGALADGADVIVSKDHHLQVLGSYHGIRIVSTQDFVRMLERGESG